jgi:hypothetical protein
MSAMHEGTVRHLIETYGYNVAIRTTQGEWNVPRHWPIELTARMGWERVQQ